MFLLKLKCKKFHYIIHSFWKGTFVPLNTPANPSFPWPCVSFAFWLYLFFKMVGGYWKSCCLHSSPERGHTVRADVLHSGWTAVWSNGRKIVFGDIGSLAGQSTRISNSVGYHGCPTHAGAISKPVALSWQIFSSILLKRTCGGCVSDVHWLQSKVNASIAIAPGSGRRATYNGTWWFSLDAKRSTSGV